jgi:hypothetical protein
MALTYQQIDAAVDRFISDEPSEFKWPASQFADLYGVHVSEASWGLQYHKMGQAEGRTKHILVPRGYGRAARWCLASTVGGVSAPYRHVGEGHIAYVARDATNRLMRDLNLEVDPAVERWTPAQQAVVEGIIDMCVVAFQTIASNTITAVRTIRGVDLDLLADEVTR